ncbi:MAG TPA: radical SAM family heme chaperone HemW [Gemmatimonadaceae bacterium]|nr:radical SAM family heme chaperone HemW [Gemmatimonadaceae bacterium]
MPPRHVYVHVPFCARRCSYCDFAIAVRSRVPSDEYVTAVASELDVRALGAPPSSVHTIYLGGGTPSRLGPDGVARLIEVVANRFPPAADAEITLEANPDDIDASSVAAWRAAGVNRISLGVQSFDDRALEWMHRTHDSRRVTTAANTLREAGLENWSLDLIFALPASLERDWSHDLESAIALAPPHISLYGLTVEPHTPIARWRDRGAIVEGTEDAYEAEYLRADQELIAAGYAHYEVSNFGRLGQWSRHNRGYWSGASYVGLGPAAHGFDGTARRWNEREYSGWLRALRTGADPVSGSETLTDENRIDEEVYLGLRTTDGLPIRPEERDVIRPWIDAGWATLHGDRLCLSATGWLRLDTLATSLTTIRSR